jgi:hypothetical protein
MKTKIALMTTDNVSAADLNVDTVKGVVTLHGKVATEGEKAKAEQVAAKIDGVKSVKEPAANRSELESGKSSNAPTPTSKTRCRPRSRPTLE